MKIYKAKNEKTGKEVQGELYYVDQIMPYKHQAYIKSGNGHTPVDCTTIILVEEVADDVEKEQVLVMSNDEHKRWLQASCENSESLRKTINVLENGILELKKRLKRVKHYYVEKNAVLKDGDRMTIQFPNKNIPPTDIGICYGPTVEFNTTTKQYEIVYPYKRLTVKNEIRKVGMVNKLYESTLKASTIISTL